MSKQRIEIVSEFVDRFEEVDIYCPNCGKKAVFQRLTDLGDKTGQCGCTSCNETFYVDTAPEWDMDTRAIARKALRAA